VTSMTATDPMRRTPLHYAALEGSESEVRSLLREGEDPNAVDAIGYSPLHFAADGNRHGIAELLLENGATVDPQDQHGNSPLWNSVLNSRGDGRTIEVLRRYGADPSLENNKHRTPLKVARGATNFDLAQFFADIP
jgi:ankyrin repeat protein